jgi:hypothetical protein
LSWAEVSEQTGDEPDTLRMRLRRAVAAVLVELDHGDSRHAD